MQAKFLGAAAVLAFNLFCCASSNLKAATLDTNSLTLMATVQTRGEYDNAGLDYWNGEPLSATNQPTYEQDQLSATLDFYVDPAQTNNLFVTVSNVFDTDYGYISGTPFTYTALTGFDFSLSIPNDASFAAAIFSNEWALPGEQLVGPDYGASSLSTTPGWTLIDVSGPGSQRDYSVGATDLNYALTHFDSVYGTTRIFGGAAFSLQFAPTIDLIRDANFASLSAQTSFGFGRYVGPGDITYLNPVIPEPSTWTMMLIGFTLLGFAGWRHSRMTYSKRTVNGQFPNGRGSDGSSASFQCFR
jgi:hypothetical protein